MDIKSRLREIQRYHLQSGIYQDDYLKQVIADSFDALVDYIDKEMQKQQDES